MGSAYLSVPRELTFRSKDQKKSIRPRKTKPIVNYGKCSKIDFWFSNYGS